MGGVGRVGWSGVESTLLVADADSEGRRQQQRERQRNSGSARSRGRRMDDEWRSEDGRESASPRPTIASATLSKHTAQRQQECAPR